MITATLPHLFFSINPTQPTPEAEPNPTPEANPYYKDYDYYVDDNNEVEEVEPPEEDILDLILTEINYKDINDKEGISEEE